MLQFAAAADSAVVLSVLSVRDGVQLCQYQNGMASEPAQFHSGCDEPDLQSVDSAGVCQPGCFESSGFRAAAAGLSAFPAAGAALASDRLSADRHDVFQ